MNKSALKKFAVDARKELRDKVTTKALYYGISEKEIKEESIVSSDAVFIDGKQLTIDEQKQRDRLIDEIKIKGYNQVIEEVAYTWFNRFTALRFMEVNNYLPTKVKVLSSTIEGSYEPDIIREALNIDLDIDKEFVYNLKISTDNDAIDRLYKYLIIKQCNGLGSILPFMFGQTNDYTMLLFPDGLLSDNSFIRKITDIEIFPEEDWKDVEIIGWLYQYYIAEENDRVIKAKKRYKKEEIPFATQLFTPNWIVRYMVQNALGRYWIESHPEDRELIDEWEFYLENPNLELDFEEKLAPYLNKNMKVEEIKCFDPAMGSGHILVYMFDLLYKIYKRYGYMDREIPKLIIENNLYGLDIDDRAYQLACFAVIMKAQQYNNRFLRDLERQVQETGEYIELNLASIQETNDFNLMDIEYLAGESEGENFDKTKAFIDQFKNAKIYGSLTEIKEFDEEFLSKRADEIINNPARRVEYQLSKDKVDNIILDLIKQTKIMNDMYDVLVTNPPYIGGRYLNPLLGELIDEKYADVKSDIFSAFMVYSFNKTKENGQLGFMTPFVWMFIKSYEKLREKIINEKDISSLVQLEYSGFDGATVPICTFTLRNYNSHLSGEYIKLSDFKGSENQPIKTMEAVKNPNVDYRYTSITGNFNKIPGSPIAYWASEKIIEAFINSKRLGSIAEPKSGLSTTDNNRFLRYWYEVDQNNVGYNYKSCDETKDKSHRWFPYNKGGAFRKWYGNKDYCVNWYNNGEDIKLAAKGASGGRIVNPEYYFRESISWSKVSSGKIAFRYKPNGHIFDVAGTSIFVDREYSNYLHSFCNSIVALKVANILSPTLNYEVGHISSFPIIISPKHKEIIEQLTKYNIQISKTDWDSFETSWDFKIHPFLKHLDLGESYKLSSIFRIWQTETEEAFNQLKSNEEELNRIFIDIYGLQDELTPEVENKDITISKVVEEKSEEDKKNSYTVDRKEAIQSFISYGVGCMFGRYSLDEEGLAYAGGEFDLSKYKTYPADKDNVLPIISDPYFENDIVSRFVDFVKVTFGEEHLSENLQYIAESIGIRGNEISIDTIRRYFIRDFYKDHVQTYKKRPIYWMFTSGRRRAFNTLIYMHRYDSATLARIRTDYLHVLQSRLEGEKQSLSSMLEDIDNTREKRQVEKQISDLDKDILELREYDEKLHTMADMMIDIDLDDGVKVNYEKFEGLVQKI